MTCMSANLQEIPKGILLSRPLSTTELDLSNNPSIKFDRNAFLTFRQLQLLNLRNCSRRDPVLLPNSLSSIELAHNFLQFDDIRITFKNASKILEYVNITHNFLEVKKVLPVIPNWLKHLNLSENYLEIHSKRDLAKFVDVRMLRLCGCNMRKIEPHAFDTLKQLSILALYNNKQKSLPDWLFRHNKMLKFLALYQIQFRSILLGKAHTRIIHIVLQLLLLSNKKKIRVLHLRHSLVCMYTQQEVLYVLL